MSVLNQNHTNQGRGGRREGAGRPKGSTKKPQISDYITAEEVRDLVEVAKSQAQDKPDLMKWLLDQVFGRARQNIGLDGGEEDKPIPILGLNVSANNSNKEDSSTQEED